MSCAFIYVYIIDFGPLTDNCTLLVKLFATVATEFPQYELVLRSLARHSLLPKFKDHLIRSPATHKAFIIIADQLWLVVHNLTSSILCVWFCKAYRHIICIICCFHFQAMGFDPLYLTWQFSGQILRGQYSYDPHLIDGTSYKWWWPAKLVK